MPFTSRFRHLSAIPTVNTREVITMSSIIPPCHPVTLPSPAYVDHSRLAHFILASWGFQCQTQDSCFARGRNICSSVCTCQHQTPNSVSSYPLSSLPETAASDQLSLVVVRQLLERPFDKHDELVDIRALGRLDLEALPDDVFDGLADDHGA